MEMMITFGWGALMSVLVFIATFVLKYPIKYITSRIDYGKLVSKITLAKNKPSLTPEATVSKGERLRHMLNIIIILIPFGLGILAWFLYLHFDGDPSTVFSTEFDVIVKGLSIGSGSILIYSIVERFTKVKNPYSTGLGKTVLDTLVNILSDGKFTPDDIDKIKDVIIPMSEVDNSNANQINEIIADKKQLKAVMANAWDDSSCSEADDTISSRSSSNDIEMLLEQMRNS